MWKSCCTRLLEEEEIGISYLGKVILNYLKKYPLVKAKKIKVNIYEIIRGLKVDAL